jgi:hypothetical protein
MASPKYRRISSGKEKGGSAAGSRNCVRNGIALTEINPENFNWPPFGDIPGVLPIMDGEIPGGNGGRSRRVPGQDGTGSTAKNTLILSLFCYFHYQ